MSAEALERAECRMLKVEKEVGNLSNPKVRNVAEEYLDEARRTYPSSSQELVWPLCNAASRIDWADHERALELLTEAHTIFESLDDTNLKLAGWIFSRLDANFRRAKSRESRIASCRRWLGIAESLGASDVELAQIRTRLAESLIDAGELVEAMEILAELRGVVQSLAPERHSALDPVWTLRNNVFRFYITALIVVGDLHTEVDVRKEELEHNIFMARAPALAELAYVLEFAGEHDAALETLREAIAIVEDAERPAIDRYGTLRRWKWTLSVLED